MASKKKKKKEKPTKAKRPKIITDPKLIEELDKLPLYICPSETDETYDKKLVKNHFLKKSAEDIGQVHPILVAVWFDDPNKDSDTSEERVHMRIIDGRHRSLDE